MPLVAIHHDSSGEPGTLLGVLGNPADPFGETRRPAGNRTFTAASALSLDANANYWLVLKDTKSTAGEENYTASAAFSAAQTGAEGFGIANGRLSWTEAEGWYTVSESVRMEIRGTVGGTGTNNAPVFDDAGVTREVAENSAADSDAGGPPSRRRPAGSGEPRAEYLNKRNFVMAIVIKPQGSARNARSGGHLRPAWAGWRPEYRYCLDLI